MREENITTRVYDTESDVEDGQAIENTDMATEIKLATTSGKSGSTGVYVHRFRKPFEFNDKKFETLNFYFGRLTGRDMISVESEIQARGEFVLDPLLSRSFQSKIASKAAGVGSDALESMPILEFTKIVNEVRNFLMDSGY